ncbi:SET domain-containing protein [Periconia macrospinosa]|uniref:SET domain-containing protein n=1 Tax=Periconia macrospinosa TaxID=97972 RepID=A0A2V1E8L6_9PLEO|nr:SET domain-containing protein [Periconia macrospinosa]
MAAALDPGEKHSLFIEWAESQGVKINGVAPAQFVDRGMGIVAAKDLKKGDCLVHVSNTTLVTVAHNSIYKMKFPASITVHARLATYFSLLAADEKSPYKLWQDVWPTEEDFKSILPLYWSKELQKLLPPDATNLLAKQKVNIEKDYQSITKLFPSISRSVFTYNWVAVNTRCFYFDYPDLPSASPRLPKKRANLTAEDCYALCPFLDYFNHASTGCNPTANAKGYSVHADRDYKAGEEVYVTYGSHSNDFLLAEYGFILSSPSTTPQNDTSNTHDNIPLDHLIVPHLSPSQVETLKTDGFYGTYTLWNTIPPAVCHRTQGVVRLLTLPERRYSAFVGGTDEGGADQARVDRFLVEALVKYEREVMRVLEEVEGLEGYAGEVLTRRWKQIGGIVRRAVKALGGEGML